MESSSLHTCYSEAGQGHVFEAWASLSPEERAALLQEAGQIDLAQIDQLYRDLAVGHADSGQSDACLEPIERDLVVDREALPEAEKAELRAMGLQLIRDGRVAVVVLAGGQGTRLGSDRPKGEFDIGLPSGKSIFQILTERFVKAQRLAGPSERCKMLVMTSGINHEQTKEFFEEHKYFGALAENVVFFQQAMLPLISKEGKILMESPSKMMLGPNGNGALFDAVNRNPEVKAVLESIDYVQVIGVDNVLNRLLDPLYFGFTAKNQLQAAMKSVVKRDAREPVGVVVKKRVGSSLKYDIVEYSEIGEADVTAIDEATGELKFNLGNILVFVLKADKLLELANKTETLNTLYHVAFKRNSYWEGTQQVKPAAPNSYKFELFLHNFLPFCERLGVMRVKREEEFAPVKNAEGVDSPQSARELVFAQSRRWLAKAGIDVGDRPVEVDVLLSYEGEGLEGVTVEPGKGPLHVIA